jgi:dienelactone hydrolase
MDLRGWETAVTNDRFVEYLDGDVLCEAYVASPSASLARPCILLAHDWSGRLGHIDRQADAMAAAGYTVFALDVYGKGARGAVEVDNSALMNPFIADRPALARRLLAALEAACSLPEVDASRVAAVGYCFGGLCALDLARTGDARLVCAVSIHGVLSPSQGERGAITASVLVLHGWEDPMAPTPDVEALAQELTESGADWQIHAYGHAMHAFTARGLNAPERGLAYNAKADRRSSAAMKNFLLEVFARDDDEEAQLGS